MQRKSLLACTVEMVVEICLTYYIFFLYTRIVDGEGFGRDFVFFFFLLSYCLLDKWNFNFTFYLSCITVSIKERSLILTLKHFVCKCVAFTICWIWMVKAIHLLLLFENRKKHGKRESYILLYLILIYMVWSMGAQTLKGMEKRERNGLFKKKNYLLPRVDTDFTLIAHKI